MPALSIADLNNAKIDVDHLAALLTSESLTATDRLGHVKMTWAGLLADLNAAAAITETGQNREVAQASATAALNSESSALAAAATAGAYPNSAASNVPRGLTQASVGAITPGSGGTNGTFNVSWSGGNFLVNPTATFTVAGGVLTAVTITGPGLYIGSSPTVPTPSFAASAGLTGAAVALTAQFLVTSGQGYWVTSADGQQLDRYKNVSGVATADTSVASIPSLTNLQDVATLNKAGVGDVYSIGAPTTIGSTTPDTSSYPSFTDTLFPASASAQRGYLKDFSIRIAGGAGTGQVIVLVPDVNSQYGYLVKAVVAVSTVNGVNTFLGSAIYTSALPIGSRVGFRWLTGGTLRQAAGGPVKRISTNAQTAGQLLSGQLLAYANDVAVAFSIRPAVTASLDERVADAEAGRNTRSLTVDATLGLAPAASNVTVGNAGLVPSGNLITSASYGIGPTTGPSILTSVTLPTSNPFSDADGTVQSSQLFVTQPDASGNQIVSHIFDIRLAPGKTDNTISGFGELFMVTGSIVWIGQMNARAPVQFKSGTGDGGGFLWNSASAAVVGNTIPSTVYSNTPVFSFTVKQATNPVSVRLGSLETKTANLAPPKDATQMLHQRFAGVSLPAGWSQAGGWTVNEGLISPAAGGVGVTALTSDKSSIASRSFIARIIVNAANAVFGICAKPPAAQGCVAMVDGAAGFLKFYAWDGLAALGTVDTQVALPAALVVGRAYLLEAEKTGLTTTLTFTDTVTLQSCTLTETQKAANRQWHGQMGVMFISGSGSAGDIKVDTFDVDALVPKTLRCLLVGDSIGEGNYLPVNSPTWMFQIKNARFLTNDVMVAARAGDTTLEFVSRKPFDLTPWLPRYVVLALGTNDTDQAGWRTRMAQNITDVLALGAEPILVTQPPRNDMQATKTAMNADIRSGFFGRYRWIDMAYALSLNNDGVTWNPAYNNGDNTHPNYAGQQRMYQQVLADAPFLVR